MSDAVRSWAHRTRSSAVAVEWQVPEGSRDTFVQHTIGTGWAIPDLTSVTLVILPPPRKNDPAYRDCYRGIAIEQEVAGFFVRRLLAVVSSFVMEFTPLPCSSSIS